VSDRLEHLRGVRELSGLRGRRAVVAVCRDDAARWEKHRAAFAAEDAELVLEALPGPISARAGRPSVVVCDRWQEVIGRHAEAAAEAVLAEVRWVGTCCEECPQAMLEPGGEGWREVPASF
jgi:hypothetical protein